MHARPMAIAKVEENGDIYFATKLESVKVADLERDPQIALTLQSSAAWVSVRGRGDVVLDRDTIEAYWSEPMRVWFPEGKSDPSLCLIRLQPSQGEFWDMQGAKGLRYIYEAAKAYVTGTAIDTLPEQHGVVPKA